MSGASYDEQPDPVIRDKRRMDPETYERRDAAVGGTEVPPSGAAGGADRVNGSTGGEAANPGGTFGS